MKNHLSQSIMRRVYAIYVLRSLGSPIALKTYILVLFAAGVASLVSVGNVVANVPTSGFYALYDFSIYALMHTELIVQMLMGGAIALLIWILRDCVRAVNALSHARHVLGN